MIEELTTYISQIQNQFPLQAFVEGPAKGLHILLEVRDNQLTVAEKEIYQPKKGEEGNYSDFLRQECLPKEIHIDYIDSNKALIGKEGKKIHSASPFALKIRKKSFDEEWKSWYPKKKPPKNIKELIEEKEEKLKNTSGEQKKSLHRELIQLKISKTSNEITGLLIRYFEKANEICSPHYKNDEDAKTVNLFQQYCIHELPNLLTGLSSDIALLNKNDDIIFLLKNIPTELYYEANTRYLKEYVFNVDYFNISVRDEIYGLSGYLNTSSDKKPYLRHLTAPFDVNIRIPKHKALLLNTFEAYRKAGAFITNPLPIFIDQSELNNEVVNAVKNELDEVSFHKVIRTLFKNKKTDLGNYYLLYFWAGTIKDLDFVSSFSFSLANMQLRTLIPKTEPEKDIPIKNIFQFEHQILQPIFNNLLIQIRKSGSIGYRYFDEIDNNPKYNTATTWNLTMKYRKAFYDFIYKSRRQTVTKAMFHDIMWQSILDDIRHDEYNENRHTKQVSINKKLNIWFSLWNFFGLDNKSNDRTMANKIEQLQEKIISLCNSDKGHIQTDDEFAFATGQVIYYLLNQSKAANKTHSLLEPFLQKTDQGELKKAIANTFNAYKHEIYFSKGKFERICGEIMGYELEGSLKELLPIILVGYFSNSIIYENKNT